MNPSKPTFEQRVIRGLDDRSRQETFDKRVYKIKGKRLAAGAAYPEWEELRERAAAIKAHTVASLGKYVEQFADRAEAAGAHVHFARTGQEATEIILDLCRQNSVQRVTKSKSMTTEECGLNEVLEAAGIRITDTVS